MKTAIPESEQQIIAACDRAISLATASWPPTLPPSKEPLGVPEWYPFEHDAWHIGESIRLAFVKNRKLRRPSAFAKVADVAACRDLRRGRQSFIMALEFPEACGYAAVLIPFLSDPDVDGQVVHTLIKMKAAGYGAFVLPLLKSDKTWIRRLAKKYVERYPAEISQ